MEQPPDAAIALLRAKYPQYHAMAIAARPIIRIHPTRSTFWTAAATVRSHDATSTD